MSSPPALPTRRWDLVVVALGAGALVAAGLSAAGVAGTPAVVVGVLVGLACAGAALGPRGLRARAARAGSALVSGEFARRAGDDPRFLPAPAATVGRTARALPWALSVTSLLLVGGFLAGASVARGAVLLAWAGLAVLLARGLLTFLRGGHALGDDLTDPLTGLASREALSEALASEGTGDGTGGVDDEGWSGWTDQVALLLADIDGFDGINATLGRETGDAVLTEVGARLRAVLRPPQLLARLGGDEFALLLPGAGRDAATRVAATLREALRTPLDVGGSRLPVQATVGVAWCRLPRGRPEDLLRQADAAVLRAKATSSGIAVYDAEKDGSGPVRLRRVDELRSALEQGDVVVHLQPQVELATGAVVGCEALARWRHPKDGVLLPDAFLPLAATTGLMRPVTDVVLDRALEACATWWPAHPVAVGVNVTAVDLLDPGLTDRITRRLARHALPGAALRVEITEEALVAEPEAAARLLRAWRRLGIATALDDFGTGYSSLAYLRELPFDELKLDRVFGSDLDRPATATIVRHCAAMAHELGLRVVAEGVEDATAARRLADLGCDIGQGLAFGAAVPPATFAARLISPRDQAIQRDQGLP